MGALRFGESEAVLKEVICSIDSRSDYGSDRFSCYCKTCGTPFIYSHIKPSWICSTDGVIFEMFQNEDLKQNKNSGMENSLIFMFSESSHQSYTLLTLSRGQKWKSAWSVRALIWKMLQGSLTGDCKSMCGSQCQNYPVTQVRMQKWITGWNSFKQGLMNWEKYHKVRDVVRKDLQFAFFSPLLIFFR